MGPGSKEEVRVRCGWIQAPTTVLSVNLLHMRLCGYMEGVQPRPTYCNCIKSYRHSGLPRIQV